MIDVETQIESVSRSVGTRVLDTGWARVVGLRQKFDVSVEELWELCTTAEKISRWFLPVSGNLRIGGRYQLEGNAGGRIEACKPPERFTATWEFGGEASWIEPKFGRAADAKSVLELKHIAHVDDDQWAEYGPGAVGIGWDMSLMGLASHIKSGESVNPESGAEWGASSEGRQFMKLSSDAWRAASVASGTEPNEADAAADRVIAVYTADS
ncbi:SRPBCC domain-containing protein [Spelaeicoccus albus]|uniref:Uncharacterized protein YndB with AHSA1/START domain n=1 Tax=Spelaeicoccus albus TaxID=1280376 RepID=A0A7Z0A9T0_9MICO|nr:uncharacterized protein YndB with AHSA1/START domain [Spelaeicoccus albus]